MIEHVKRAVAMNQHYAKVHLEDIPDDLWCRRAEATWQHPASILAHLVCTYEFGRVSLGGEPWLPPEWGQKFAGSAAAEAAPSAYPPETELIAALDRERSALLAMLESATPEDLAKPVADERIRDILPTAGDMLVAMLTVHESMHLGQLSAWRRAMGLPLHI